MMNSLYLGVGGVIAGIAIGAYTSLKSPDPVAVSTEITAIERYDDRVEIMLTWYNQRNCEFSTLSTMQGSHEFPDALRTPIERSLGKPKGPRGKGNQATVKPWVFYRPETIHAPEFIMTAWHKCGAESVPSTMLVVDIRDWWPE
jgi:hypothetical protein